MKFTAATALTSLLGVAAAAKDERTFAVLHFTNKQLTIARADPIVNPGQPSTHVHHVLGGSNFGLSSTGEELKNSKCSTALIKGDNSNYWFPSLYFKDPKSGNLESVELFYANVYYFFEPTNDDIKAFPTGLQMFTGDPTARTPPASGATSNFDASKGPINGIKWTCPRSNIENNPGWPVNSNGQKAGMQDPGNKGEGVGFPDVDCDGYASPLRADIHFPSCYNPKAGLTDYKNNMAWPKDNNGKEDCPEGWIHVPHLFFEAYWNTPVFANRWEQGKGEQPFVLANGDATGYSLHADFMAAWDEPLLQNIIDTCNTGTGGMDHCPGLTNGLNKGDCTIESPVDETVTGIMSKLPGNNPLTGWSYGAGDGGNQAPNPSQGQSSSAAPSPMPASSAAPSPIPVSSAPASSAPASSAPASSAPASTEPGSPAPASSSATNSLTPPSVTFAPIESSASSQIQPSGASSSTLSGAPSSPSDKCTPATVHTVYKTVTVTAGGPAPTSTGGAGNDVGGFKYAGCFKDAAGRALNGKVRPDIGRMSNEKCVAECKKLGFSAAGTEYGGQCYCGNELEGSERLDESACNMACEDNASSMCGGSWTLSVYSKDGEVSLKNAQRRRHMHEHVKRHSGRF
ncbi:hypothetical protein LLEC1_02031 [Akanthomyces lecanii]|uniref:WSC domain-containing protein n=1 Tax=Cordyceps confragosa TaxID=2714763 RepID=A0A179HZG9_CORDF|nr:hypothetical protein LLEC1_02031 [Akanthomyces lecanii]